MKDNYRVTIKGLPVDTNADAQIKPHAVILELQCGEKTTSLVNLMFPVREVFNWSPANCGDVTLTIEVGTRKLTRRYSGDMPFRSFLLDFSGGDRRFRTERFSLGVRCPETDEHRLHQRQLSVQRRGTRQSRA